MEKLETNTKNVSESGSRDEASSTSKDEKTTTKSSRRKRGRGNRRGRGYKKKPYSQMTWRERRDLEILDEIRDEKREQKKRKLTSIPKDAEGRILNGVNAKDYRPGAPKNTTQYLLEKSIIDDNSLSSPPKVVDDDLEFDGETLDDLGTMSVMEQHKQEEDKDNSNNLMNTIRKQSAMIESLQHQRAQDVKDSVVMKQRINKLETTLRDLNKKFERFRRLHLPPSSQQNDRNMKKTSDDRVMGSNNDGKKKTRGGGRRRRRSESDKDQ